MSDWEAHWDEASQAYYYSNNITGETTWDQPADYVPPDAAHVADHDAAGSAGAAAADSGLGAVEWRMHPEHDTACCFTDFVDEYGESDGQAYWEDAIPMRADANGTVMTQDEFLADYGDDGGLEAWEAAPMAFDPNSVHNFDDATGTDLSAEPAKVKVRFWRDKRAQLLSGSPIHSASVGTPGVAASVEAGGYSIDMDISAVGAGINLEVAAPDVVADSTQSPETEQSIESPWMECWDQTQNAYYYYNATTAETVWEKPEGFVSTTSGPNGEGAYKLANSKLVGALKIQALFRGVKARSAAKKLREEKQKNAEKERLRQQAEAERLKKEMEEKKKEEEETRRKNEEAKRKQEDEERKRREHEANQKEEEAAAAVAARKRLEEPKAEERDTGGAAKQNNQKEAQLPGKVDEEGNQPQKNDQSARQSASQLMKQSPGTKATAATDMATFAAEERKKRAADAAAEAAREEAERQRLLDAEKAANAHAIAQLKAECQRRLTAQQRLVEALRQPFMATFLPAYTAASDDVDQCATKPSNALRTSPSSTTSDQSMSAKIELALPEAQLLDGSTAPSLFSLCSRADDGDNAVTPMDVVRGVSAVHKAGVQVDQLGFSPAMICALFGRVNTLKALVVASDDLGKLSDNEDPLRLCTAEPAAGATALHIAALRQDVAIATALLQAVDSSQVPRLLASTLGAPSGATALHIACAASDTHACRKLCQLFVPLCGSPVAIDAATCNGLTALRISAVLGRVELVSLLVETGGACVDCLPAADPAVVSASIDSINQAVRARKKLDVTLHQSSVRRLDHGETKPICLWRTPPSTTPSALHSALAAPSAQWECCEVLLAAKASLSLPWKEVHPPVPLLCPRRCVTVAPAVTLLLTGNLGQLQSLLELAPDAVAPHTRYFDGNTLLHIAARLGDLDAMDLLDVQPSAPTSPASRNGSRASMRGLAGQENDEGLTAEALLKDRYQVDLPLLRRRASYPESFEPFPFDVEGPNIRSMFAAQDPVLWNGRALVHGQFQRLLQDLSTFPTAEELFLDLAEDLWAAWNECGDVNFAAAEQSVSHQIDSAQSKGLRGVVLDDVLSLVRRCHRLSWAQRRTAEIFDAQAAEFAALLDTLRRAVRRVKSMDPKTKSRESQNPPDVETTLHRTTSYGLVVAVADQPLVLRELRNAIDAAVAFCREHDADYDDCSPQNPLTKDAHELEEADELFNFVVQSKAVVEIQRHARGMADRALVARLVAQKRHSHKATSAFGKVLNELPDDSKRHGLGASGTVSNDQAGEEQRLAHHFIELQGLRRELVQTSALIKEQLAAAAPSDNPTDSSKSRSALFTKATGAVQHAEVTSRVLVKHLRIIEEYVCEHLHGDPLAERGVVEQLAARLEACTNVIENSRKFVSTSTVHELHSRRRSVIPLRMNTQTLAESIDLDGAENSNETPVPVAKPKPRRLISLSSLDTLTDAFNRWNEALADLNEQFEGVVLAAKTDPESGVVREILERLTQTTIDGVDAAHASESSTRSADSSNKKNRDTGQRQHSTQKHERDRQRKMAFAAAEEAAAAEAVENRKKAAIAAAAVAAATTTATEVQTGSASGPSARRKSPTNRIASISSSTVLPESGITQSQNIEDDEQLMQVINEEMELRQLQTVLAEAQFANHREVRQLQRRLAAEDARVKLSDLEGLENDMMALEDQYSAAAWSKHEVISFVRDRLADSFGDTPVEREFRMRRALVNQIHGMEAKLQSKRIASYDEYRRTYMKHFWNTDSSKRVLHYRDRKGPANSQAHGTAAEYHLNPIKMSPGLRPQLRDQDIGRQRHQQVMFPHDVEEDDEVQLWHLHPIIKQQQAQDQKYQLVGLPPKEPRRGRHGRHHSVGSSAWKSRSSSNNNNSQTGGSHGSRDGEGRLDSYHQRTGSSPGGLGNTKLPSLRTSQGHATTPLSSTQRQLYEYALRSVGLSTDDSHENDNAQQQVSKLTPHAWSIPRTGSRRRKPPSGPSPYGKGRSRISQSAPSSPKSMGSRRGRGNSARPTPVTKPVAPKLGGPPKTHSFRTMTVPPPPPDSNPKDILRQALQKVLGPESESAGDALAAVDTVVPDYAAPKPARKSRTLSQPKCGRLSCAYCYGGKEHGDIRPGWGGCGDLSCMHCYGNDPKPSKKKHVRKRTKPSSKTKDKSNPPRHRQPSMKQKTKGNAVAAPNRKDQQKTSKQKSRPKKKKQPSSPKSLPSRSASAKERDDDASVADGEDDIRVHPMDYEDERSSPVASKSSAYAEAMRSILGDGFDGYKEARENDMLESQMVEEQDALAESKRKRKEEEIAAAEAERQRKQKEATAEAERKAQEEAAAEAERQRKAEEEAAAEAERQRKAAEEAAAEAERKAQEEAAAEAERQRKAEEEAAAEAERQRKSQEEATAEAERKRKAEEEAAAEAERQRKAEEEAAAEAERQRKAEEEAAAEAERQRKAEEEAAAEAERERKAEEEAAAEAERQRKAEEEAAAEAERKAQEQAAAEAERQRKAEEETAAEAERQRKAEEEAAAEAERQRKAEEEAAAEAERQRKAEEEAAAEAERKRKAAAEAAAEAERVGNAEEEVAAEAERKRKAAEEAAAAAERKRKAEEEAAAEAERKRKAEEEAAAEAERKRKAEEEAAAESERKAAEEAAAEAERKAEEEAAAEAERQRKAEEEAAAEAERKAQEQAAAEAERQRKAEEEAAAEAERKGQEEAAAEAERQRKAEEEAAAEAERQRKAEEEAAAEAERKAAEEAAAEAERQRKAEEEAAAEAERQRKAKEEAAAEAERQQKAEEEAAEAERQRKEEEEAAAEVERQRQADEEAAVAEAERLRQEEEAEMQRVQQVHEAVDHHKTTVAVAAAVHVQQMFRDRRGRAVLQENNFSGGAVSGVDPEIVAIADNVDDTIIESQARVAWAWDNGKVRTFNIVRDNPDWQTQSMGINCELPGQIDLTHHGFEMRVSDPFLHITNVNEDSYMAAHGVQPGDAVITVNGEDFDTIGEFAALTKVSPNMVMQTFHIPETPGFYEDDAEGMKVLQEYKNRVRNAILMRVGHEVKVRDAWMHAHENDLEQEERFVPVKAVDKMRTLDSLLGFLVLQNMGKQVDKDGPAPLLCHVVSSLESMHQVHFSPTRRAREAAEARANAAEIGADHLASDPRPEQDAFEDLERAVQAWKERRRAYAMRAHGDSEAAGSVFVDGPSEAFMAQYAHVIQTFPQDYGRADYAGEPIVWGSLLGGDMQNDSVYNAYDQFEDLSAGGNSAVDGGQDGDAAAIESGGGYGSAAEFDGQTQWTQIWDDASQAYYYENQTTGETSWDAPEHYHPAE